MKDANWVIIDTETDGISDPIHVVEIAAQRMSGWNPVGEKFRILLNHGVPIPPEATAVHGYTREFLKKHGSDPVEAHNQFREYVGGLPLVAHNLSFDWNRALFPEWLRLGLEPVGQRGFCTLMLSRRVIDESKSYRLDALRETFNLSKKDAHRAFSDVGALVELFERVFRQRLEAGGIETFESIANFSKMTPVAKCLSQLKSSQPKPANSVDINMIDQWYFVDAHSKSQGPWPASEILRLMGCIPCWVWKEGFTEWVSSEQCEEFLIAAKSPLMHEKNDNNIFKSGTQSVQELIGLCRGIIADGKITTAEVMFLSKWLEDAGVITDWPATYIADAIERITSDGRVTKEEKDDLLLLLQCVCI